MSFTGDLEYLPIVDVLQLLHASRKSGVLRVRGRRGESQLVFKEGYIVSASHLNNSVRIGKILLDMGVISEDTLEQALQEQQRAGGDRKPLIVTLLDMGLTKEEDAYRGLEHLIEMTIVDILNWKRGTFVLEPKPEPATDEYRYYPDRIQREISVDTQGALMEALRIYDERVRDGLLQEETDEDEFETPPSESSDTERLLSADDLGLGDMDHLETRPRPLFTSLNDENPAKQQLSRLKELAPQLSQQLLQQLTDALLATDGTSYTTGPLPALIIFTPDEFLGHCIATACSRSGMFICTVRESAQLSAIIERCTVLNSSPVILFDTADAGDVAYAQERQEALAHSRRHLERGIPLLQLADPGDQDLMLQAYAEGIRSVLPRPTRLPAAETDILALIRFLQSLQGLLDHCLTERGADPLARLKNTLTRCLEQPTPQGVAATLLQQMAGIGDRSLTLVLKGDELIAEKGIGVTAHRSEGMVPAPALRIPVSAGSLLQRVIDEGRAVSGNLDEPALRDHLFPHITPPATSAGMLLPIRRRGRTLALIYGDFGNREAAAVNGDLLDLLAALASLVLDKIGRAEG